MMVQDPTGIPVPPAPPEVIVHNIGAGGPMSEEVLFAIVVICLLIGAVYILGPIAKAIARRLERHGGDPALQDELESLRERVGEVDQLRERMMELEERVDFAERLLARPAEVRAELLPAPEQKP
jgi:Tfp pilus assembly protein PilO